MAFEVRDHESQETGIEILFCLDEAKRWLSSVEECAATLMIVTNDMSHKIISAMEGRLVFHEAKAVLLVRQASVYA